MNPADRNALEFALQIKEKAARWNATGGKVEITSLMLAPSGCEGILKETLALEADRAVILSDPGFSAAEGTAIALALGQAASKLKADLILCGEGPLGHRVAEEMKIPSVHSVTRILFDQGRLKLASRKQEGEETIEAFLPLLASVIAGSNTPRMANAMRIMKAAKKEIIRWTAADIELTPDKIGPAVSGMERVRSFTPD